jgi:hypothetical protein
MLYVHVTQRLSHTGMPQAIGFSNMTNMVCFQARLTKPSLSRVLLVAAWFGKTDIEKYGGLEEGPSIKQASIPG